MEFIYSTAQIEAFSQKKLEVQGTDPDTEIRVRRDFADAIKNMDSWMQIILIESGFSNIVMPLESVKARVPKAAGYFSPATKGKPIVWSYDSVNLPAQNIMRHEEGHRVDHILISREEASSSWFFSDINDQWKEALRKELHYGGIGRGRPGFSSNPNPLNQLSQLFSKGASPPLYESYRPLGEHLKSELYKDPSTHPHEAMAEMYNHYATLYADYRGNNQAVDGMLTAYYPYLWPVYRDEVIPKAEAHAEALAKERACGIEFYVDESRTLYDLQGKDFDEAETREHAGRLWMDGAIDHETRIVRKAKTMYKDPLEGYVDAQENLARERSVLSGTEFEFDYIEEMRQAVGLQNERGLHGLVAERVRIVEEYQALDLYAEKKTAFALDAQIAKSPEQVDGRVILKEFDALKEEGLAKVWDAIKAIPGKVDVHRYYIAKAEQHEVRCDLENRYGTLPEDFDISIARQIEAITNAGGLETLRLRTKSIRAETNLMYGYASDAHRMVDRIARISGYKPPLASRRILQTFDKLMLDGGADAVKDDARKFKISQIEIHSYVKIREDLSALKDEIATIAPDEPISWGRKSGLYSPSSGFVPRELSQAISQEIFSHAFEGGAEQLNMNTARLQIEAHALIGNRIGKVLPVPEDLLQMAKLSPRAEQRAEPGGSIQPGFGLHIH